MWKRQRPDCRQAQGDRQLALDIAFDRLGLNVHHKMLCALPTHKSVLIGRDCGEASS